MPWRILRSILFIGLASISALAQSYQTQFTEVKFDRSKGPGTLHGPVEVEGATGAVTINSLMGTGIGTLFHWFEVGIPGELHARH